MAQSTICIVVSVGRTMIAQYMINPANIFNVNTFAIGKGNVGLSPDPSQTKMSSLMQIATKDLTAITTETFTSPSIAEYYCEIPNSYVSPDPISEFGIYYKDTFPGNTDETGAVMLAYATFEGIVKTAGDALSFTVRIQI